MSLHFDYSKVPHDVVFVKTTDPEEIAYFREYHRTLGRKVIDNGDDDFRIFSPKTEQLIWLTMSIGISRITKKNWTKFYARSFAWQRVRGHDIVVTAQDVYDHIGLFTNASSLTDSKFNQRLASTINLEAQRAIKGVDTSAKEGA